MSNIFKLAFEEVQERIDTRTIEEIEEEHQRLALEIEEDSREVDRQSDLVEGLESLRMIASHLDTPTSSQVALFKVAANMAVAGTKEKAQDFLPAMESSQPIALEGFGDKIKEIIKKIIDFVKNIYLKIKNFILNITKSSAQKEKEIEELKHKIDQAKKAEAIDDRKKRIKEKYKTKVSVNVIGSTLRTPKILSLISKKNFSSHILTIDDINKVSEGVLALTVFVNDFSEKVINNLSDFNNKIENLSSFGLKGAWGQKLDYSEENPDLIKIKSSLSEIEQSFVSFENLFNSKFSNSPISEKINIHGGVGSLKIEFNPGEAADSVQVDIDFKNFDDLKNMLHYQRVEIPLVKLNELNSKTIKFLERLNKSSEKEDYSYLISLINKGNRIINEVIQVVSTSYRYHDLVWRGIVLLGSRGYTEYNDVGDFSE